MRTVLLTWPCATSSGPGHERAGAPARAYPELFAVVGPTVPDLRGLFLRGYGSQVYAQNNGSTVGVTATLHSSGELGQVQGDATRGIEGTASIWHYLGYASSGVFESKSRKNVLSWSGGNGDKGYGSFLLNSSRVTPTAPENRPVNTAVRYLVRTRP